MRSNEITLRDDAGNEVYHSPPATYKQGRNAPELVFGAGLAARR